MVRASFAFYCCRLCMMVGLGLLIIKAISGMKLKRFGFEAGEAGRAWEWVRRKLENRGIQLSYG